MSTVNDAREHVKPPRPTRSELEECASSYWCKAQFHPDNDWANSLIVTVTWLGPTGERTKNETQAERQSCRQVGKELLQERAARYRRPIIATGYRVFSQIQLPSMDYWDYMISWAQLEDAVPYQDERSFFTAFYPTREEAVDEFNAHVREVEARFPYVLFTQPSVCVEDIGGWRAWVTYAVAGGVDEGWSWDQMKTVPAHHPPRLRLVTANSHKVVG